MNLKGLWAEFKAFAFKGNMIELAVAVVIGAAFSTVINSLVNDVIMPTVGYVVNTATTAAEKAKDVAETAVSKTGIAGSQSGSPQANSSQANSEAVGVPAGATSQPVAAGSPAMSPTADTANNLTPTEAKLADALKAAVAAVSAADQKAAADAKAADDAKAAKAAPVRINLQLGPVNAGAFIGALLNFLLVAAAVFFCIVKLLGTVMNRVKKAPAPSEPVSKECPRCLSIIPIKATKCANCTADLPAAAAL